MKSQFQDLCKTSQIRSWIHQGIGRGILCFRLDALMFDYLLCIPRALATTNVVTLSHSQLYQDRHSLEPPMIANFKSLFNVLTGLRPRQQVDAIARTVVFAHILISYSL